MHFVSVKGHFLQILQGGFLTNITLIIGQTWAQQGYNEQSEMNGL